MQNVDYVDPADQEKQRCFATSAALTVEATKLLEKGVAVGDTINIDVAPRLAEAVEWSKKITVQLSRSELPIFAAVMLGYLPSASFKRSGKGIDIIRQPNKLYVNATAGKGNNFSLPVPIPNCYFISTLVLKQLSKNSEGLNPEFIIASLRGAASLYSQPE